MIRKYTINKILLFLIIVFSLPIYIFWGQEFIQKLIIGSCSLLYIGLNNIGLKKKHLAVFIITTLYIFYSSFPGVEGKSSFINFAYCSLFFFFLSDIQKNQMFDILRKTFAIILLLGIVSYALVVLNLISPMYTITNNIRDSTYNIYPFFALEELSFGHNLYNYGMFRFNSFFDEPGYVGTMCALFILCDFNFKTYNKIFIIAGFLSFSMAFWALFIMTLVINIKFNMKYIYIVLIVSILTAIFYGVLYDVVFYRFEIQDGRIVGDNRVEYKFKVAYDNFLNSDKYMFGMGNIAHQNYPGSSTYKGLIYNFGFFGFVLYLLIFILMAVKKINYKTLLFFIVFMSNIYQRPYSLSLITFIMLYIGLNNILCANKHEENIHNNPTVQQRTIHQ